MKASIIYTVAVSVVVISTLEIRLDNNNFGKIRSGQALKKNSIVKTNVNQKATIEYSKAQLAQTNSDDKNKGTLALAKPVLVLEETPAVYTLATINEKRWSSDSAIIEENENEETQTLDTNEFNTFLATEEAFELPVFPNKEVSVEAVARQENAIIEEADVNETKALDFNWINTLTMFDEVVAVPARSTTDSILNFSIVGEDSALEEQPLDFKWIETLQMFDEPIMIPQHFLSDNK
ncbi:hypothetical protein ACSVH5_04610 [Flavobacterium sp. RSSA_27]|uniref:hypothetical protein n=1 Tax=Flavobacterium sp. RSSA_27 TaxID=3447667 RepID=UPI003F3156B9